MSETTGISNRSSRLVSAPKINSRYYSPRKELTLDKALNVPKEVTPIIVKVDVSKIKVKPAELNDGYNKYRSFVESTQNRYKKNYSHQQIADKLENR